MGMLMWSKFKRLVRLLCAMPPERPITAVLIKKIRNKLKRKRLFYTTHFVHGPKERLIVGNKVSLANTLLNTRSGQIVIKDMVIFGHNVMVLTGIHDINGGGQKKRLTLVNANRDIIIEKGAWIASGVIIVGPVRIGENSVIGAGSVVVKNIPDNVLAVGNPAKPVKSIEPKSDN